MISWIFSFFYCPTFDDPPLKKEEKDPINMLLDRIDQIRARLIEASQTRVFEFRCELPEYFHEYQNVETSLAAAQRILSKNQTKNSLLLAHKELLRAEKALSIALKNRSWKRIR